jgi:putative transposase
MRAFVPGGRFFFTVTLPGRRRKFLTEPLDNLRASFMAARQRRPFTVETSVMFPDPVRRLEIE